MKKPSFFLKLFVGNLLLVGIITAVSCGVSYLYLDQEYQAKAERRQRHLLNVVHAHFDLAWPMPTAEADRDCKRLAKDLDARITLIAHDGRVLGDSQADAATMENHKTPDRPEVVAALDRMQFGSSTRTSETTGVAYRYFGAPVVRPKQGQEKRAEAAVRVAMPVSTLVEGGSFIRRALWWAALAAGAAAVVLGLLLSWLWYAPLRQITHAARKIASGNLQHKAHIRGSDELADLGHALNEMRQSLAAQISKSESQRESLAAVIANLQEGVIALGGQDRIVLINTSARTMLATEDGDVTGRHVQSVVRIPQVADVLENLPADASVDQQIEIDLKSRHRILQLHVARMPSAPEADIATLVVVRDITELARAAAMKAEFVANASHELRTPLATLRAAVDSLAAADPGDAAAVERLTAILHRNVKRLEDMTCDLLDLHLIEQSRHKLRIEEVTLGELGDWVREQYRLQAEEKPLAFAVLAPQPQRQLRTDRRLIQLILQNLVDNAVKYTPAGGDVSCRLEDHGGEVAMVVTDTGCGIPPEAQGRVFERFFQADPSRARQLGQTRGTGLGLAIVKYAAERLGASVDLESAVGQGTTVTVRLATPPKP